MSNFILATSIPTPYEVSILILIYLHLTKEIHLSLKCFFKLISSSSTKSSASNYTIERRITFKHGQEPLLPFLESVLKCIAGCDPKSPILLIKSLESIVSIDQILSLEKTLLNDFNIKPMSYLGEFIRNCAVKFDVSTFEDRNLLLENIQVFIDCFTNNSHSEINSVYLAKCRESKFKLRIFEQFNNGEDRFIQQFDPMMYHLEGLVKNETSNGLLISEIHLQNLINLEIQRTINNEESNDSPESIILKKCLSNLSLNNLTIFPSIHILNYFRCLKEFRYQDALDSLHVYYDYMLARNMDENYHLSLLNLGLFHLYFNDKKAPMASFQEAFKIARENRDIKTLNNIHLEILQYLEDHPRDSLQLADQTDKIIENLQKFSGRNNVTIFEGAYRAEAVLLLKNNGNLIQLLETSFQYLTISLQQEYSQGWFDSFFKFYSKVWDSIGYSDVSFSYRKFYTETELDKSINDCLGRITSTNNQYEEDTCFNKRIETTLKNLSLPTLIYEQQVRLQLLEIMSLIGSGQLNTAIDKVSGYIEETSDLVQDNYWNFQYKLQLCKIFIRGNMGQRALPILNDMITTTQENKNPLQSSRCLLMLCEILYQLDKYDEMLLLLKRNLDVLLQFEDTKGRSLELYTVLINSLHN